MPTPSHFTALDGMVLAIYFAVTMGIGFFFWRKSKSVDGFTAANRSLPGWLTGLSILGTYVSSISFLAVPGRALSSNWNAFVFSISIPLAAWVAVRWFMPFYRKGGHVSAYVHLEERFGPWARIYTSACYLLTQFARIGTVMYLMALPMNVLLGWNIHWIILATGVAVTLYTFVGGIVAVIWNDAIQTVVLIVGALVCFALMIVALPGGFGQFIEVGSQHNKFDLGSYSFDLATPTFWVVLAYGIVINLQNFGIDQNYIQRYHAASSDREAAKSIWLGALLYVPVSAIFFLIGTALFAYYTAGPGALPEAYQGEAQADKVFPYFIVTSLPSGVTGLLIAAIFAAAMSTVSTSLNSSATIILSDYYKRYLRKNSDEHSDMRTLYITTIIIGTLGTCIALALTKVSSALDAWWLLAGIFGGGTLGLFLLGFLSRRATNLTAIIGVTCGVILIVWMTLSPRAGDWFSDTLRNPFHSFLIIVFGTATILLVGLIATSFLNPRITHSSSAEDSSSSSR